MDAGLYVHVPFCETKCGYCDFYSLPLKGHDPSPVVQAILRELARRERAVEARFRTIFVGGGTPTLLPADDLRRLFTALGNLARRDAVAEFTTEANPATIDAAVVETLIACGVDRVSLGAQSFHQHELDVLERLHSPADIGPGVRAVRRGGIARINLDLIFGIPGQTLTSWRESLMRALNLDTDHLACYGLTFEPDTPLTNRLMDGRVVPCDNELEAEMYLLAVELLAEHGLQQYEISNFARPGRECRHNLTYWDNQPYLGVGPSAASYVDGCRFKNVAHIETYISDVTAERPTWREEERLTGEARAGETAMLQLRLNRGIDVSRFNEEVGINPLTLFERQISGGVRDGVMESDGQHIRLTDRGRLVADRVIRELLADPQPVPLRVLPAARSAGETCRSPAAH